MHKLNINKKIINKIKMLLPLSLMIGGNMVSADLWSLFSCCSCPDFFGSCCSCPDIPEEKTEIIIPKKPLGNFTHRYYGELDEESDSEVPKIKILQSNTPLQIEQNNIR